MLWLFPDRHVSKRFNKTPIREMQFNDNGVHFNGPMMIPPVSRFKECPIQHIHENQRKYAVHGIERIHVKYATFDLDRLADYAGKTIKWNRANPDDILVLPENRKRLTGKPLSLEDRAIRDIQSRHNVSEGIAKEMLSG